MDIKLTFSIFEDPISKIFDFVEYSIGEHYECKDKKAFNIAAFGIFGVILNHSLEDSCDRLVNSALLGEDGNLSVAYRVISNDGDLFKIEFLGESEEELEYHMEEIAKGRLEQLEEFSIKYAEIHHGKRTEENAEAFDEEAAKFLKGLEYL